MKQHNRALTATAIACFAMLTTVIGASAAMLDGATIVTTASTNTAGYAVKIHSDGHGVVAVQNQQERAFTIDPSLAKKFLEDAKAARANPGTPGHCMKSASFGTATTVTWHNYTSIDLQCPPYSQAVAMLAHDVQAIQQAAGVGAPVHRIRLPIDQRRVPTPASPAQPEPSVTVSPSMSPTR